MLRRLKVRARLLTVIAVPLLLLLVVAAPQVVQRWQRAVAADDAAALARSVADIAETVDALQRERVLSAAWRAGARDVAAQLADQRSMTDAVADRGRPAVRRIAERSPALEGAAATAAAALDDLADVRAQTDAARSIVPWVDPFAPVLDALLTVQEDLGSVVADAGVGDELTQAGLLARSKDAASAQTAQLAAATTWDELRGDQLGILARLRADELAYRTAYLAAASSAVRVDRRAEVQEGAVTSAGRVVDEVIADGDVSATGESARWLDLGARRQSTLQSVEAARAADALAEATALGDASREASTAYAALAAVGLVVALAIALLATRSITRPLRRLTDAADHLAEERLPRLVDALRHPSDVDRSYLSATVEPIEVRSDDELAHLGRAFNAVQAVAVDVAVQQADLLRRGISDLYVNLARRNQSLIERQIELLDRLEAGEEDPAVLEHLFLLDHLATRMRRNAESLLVLAGAESGPRRARPIDLVDVVRAALSEVEDYERVQLGTVVPGTLLGPVVSDVAHLLAELLENATSFSPPETPVRVDGNRIGGSYQIVITDQGVGMPPEQLDELNEVLRDPPMTGLELGRSLGCLVAARLAARHGISVRLRAGEEGGISAHVVVPRDLIDEEPPTPRPEVARDMLLALEEQVPITPVLPVVPQVTVGGIRMPGAPSEHRAEPDEAPWVPDDGLPARLRDALPSPARFEAGLQTLLDSGGAAPRREPAVPSFEGRGELPSPRPKASFGSTDAAATLPSTVEPNRHALVRRVPGASASGASPELPADRVRRSPEEVRALLLRYRSGLHAGRAAGEANPQEGS
jgi:signal transduction histidine kinase